MTTSTSSAAPLASGLQARWNADRFGVFASVLCAIHCAATPFLLLILPTFGKVWAHPASHWLMALIVVPIALMMVSKGYKRHQRKWIIAIGFLGVFFVLIGAVAPYFEKAAPTQVQLPGPASSSSSAAIMASSTSEDETTCDTDCEANCEESSSCDKEASCDEESTCQEMAASGDTDGEVAVTGCVDSCCPSLVVQADGSKSLHIPLASILTTIGGIFLIVTHIGNLCQCACCQKDDEARMSETRASSFT